LIEISRTSLGKRVFKLAMRRPSAVSTNPLRLLRKALRVLYYDGWSGFYKKALNALNRGPIAETYESWIALYDTLTPGERNKIRDEIANFVSRPMISLILCASGKGIGAIEKSILSIRKQLYPEWELCIVTDSSLDEQAFEELHTLVRQDQRIGLLPRQPEQDISAALNSAISHASSDFIALANADDELAEHALYWVAKEILAHPDADLVFSDEDYIDNSGIRTDPVFKPDWNPALMLSRDAFGSLGVYRKKIMENAGGWKGGLSRQARHELVLRCELQTQPARIRHISRILYHQRLDAHGSDTTAELAARGRPIEEVLAKKGITAQVKGSPQGYEVNYPTPVPLPHVSILIPTTGNPALFGPCLESILKRTTYDNFEVLVLVNQVQFTHRERAATLALATADARVKIRSYSDRPFNYSWINNWGARQAQGEFLLLLNDDTEIISADWIEKLIARVSFSGVGAAGPMMYYADNTIQSAGVILGIGGIAHHVFSGEPRGATGYFGRACLEQDFSCITAACMAIRKDLFFQVGGFDEKLPAAFNDVDLCMRLRQAGWRIIWTPTVELYHKESKSLGRHDAGVRAKQHLADIALMRMRWGPLLDSDPYYNRNLSLRYSYELAFPPR
jgi:glycosyltransferase involved in cell wall biosynthesis